MSWQSRQIILLNYKRTFKFAPKIGRAMHTLQESIAILEGETSFCKALAEYGTDHVSSGTHINSETQNSYAAIEST